MKSTQKFPFYFFVGISIFFAVELCIIFQIKTITIWTTPLLWTALILSFDGIIYRNKKKSLIKSGSIIPMAIISIVSWWIFEWFNIFLANWKYYDLIQPLWVRYIGYFWAFATIIPGILLTYGVLNSVFRGFRGKTLKVLRPLLVSMFLTGLLFLIIPVIPFSMYFSNRAADINLFIFLQWAANTYFAEFTAAFVWLGFFLILEPLNYAMGNRCLLRSMSEGNYKPLAVLSITGMLDGFLWEFWNYWAFSKWKYTVPILGDIKLFEMPVLGYLGFVAFAWELYNMISLLQPKAIEILED